MRLDRGDLSMESILELIEKYDIQDGAVLTGVGSAQECKYHGVKSLAETAEQQYFTKKEPMEILSISGIIAAGEPHLHATPSG